MLKDMFVEMAKGRETPAGDRIRDLVTRYLATFATGDIEARVALFAPDGSFEDPVGTPPMVGHDALRAFFQDGRHVELLQEEIACEPMINARLPKAIRLRYSS